MKKNLLFLVALGYSTSNLCLVAKIANIIKHFASNAAKQTSIINLPNNIQNLYGENLICPNTNNTEQPNIQKLSLLNQHNYYLYDLWKYLRESDKNSISSMAHAKKQVKEMHKQNVAKYKRIDILDQYLTASEPFFFSNCNKERFNFLLKESKKYLNHNNNIENNNNPFNAFDNIVLLKNLLQHYNVKEEQYQSNFIKNIFFTNSRIMNLEEFSSTVMHLINKEAIIRDNNYLIENRIKVLSNRAENLKFYSTDPC